MIGNYYKFTYLKLGEGEGGREGKEEEEKKEGKKEERERKEQIKEMETSLIGSRELMSKDMRKQLFDSMVNNSNKLCREVHEFCIKLQDALTPGDGFRKQDTPLLLYRYFSDMSAMFSKVLGMLKQGAYYCLVIGYNRTTIGTPQTIDTPRFLALEAVAQGFQLTGIKPLETYQRYGLHSKKSITGEALLILKK